MKEFLPKKYFLDNHGIKRKTRIAVALSGGVDSSVVLAMLKEKNYDVFGMYFKTYKPDGDSSHCKKEGNDAREVCHFLDVPFFAIDLQDEYRKEVFEYMIDSYRIGETPNPDILCNKKIKFGYFLRYAKKEGADFVATGHYANHVFENKNKKASKLEWKSFLNFYKIWNLLKKIQSKESDIKSVIENNFYESDFDILKDGKKHFLSKALDQEKDQTYFLSQISRNSLRRSLFPLGNIHKKDVRKLAHKYGLLTADKKDSQGICFIQKEVKIKDFLGEFIESKKGKILDIEGREVGEHDGAVFFTIGQRHGFQIFAKEKRPDQGRLFVVKKDIKKNTITVAEKKYLEKVRNDLEKKEVFLKNFHFLTDDLSFVKNYQGRIRHRGKLESCKISMAPHMSAGDKELEMPKNAKYLISFTESQKAIARGQFLALYDGDICIGGGEIA